MSLTALLVLPLVGGYAFSTIWNVSDYIGARESGHRLYFRAVFYGVFLTVSASLIHIILFVHCGYYTQLLTALNEMITTPQTKICLWGSTAKTTIFVESFVLGPFFSLVLNGLNVFPRWQKWAIEHAIANNDFEKLIVRSIYTGLPILIDKSTNKVYVGWATDAPNPAAERKWVRILPMLSGYRTSDTKELRFTTSYYTILDQLSRSDSPLEHLHQKDFEVVIPVDVITSAHLFDLNAYAEFPSPQVADKIT